MIAVADLLHPTASRFPMPVRAADTIYVHLANAQRRALVKAIRYTEVPELTLRARYGRSWAAVQSDLRALLKAGIVLQEGVGIESTYCLDLGAFPLGMLENLIGAPARRQRRALRVAA